MTGASRRVGRAIAVEFARRGADLLLTTRARNSDLEETVSLAEREGATAEIDEVDLAEARSIESFLERRAGETLDVLVLNASRYERSEHGALSAHAAMRAAKEAEEFFRVNAASAVALAYGLAGALGRSARAGGGAVVALGDMHADGRPVRGFAPYLMSKAALSQLVHALAVELAPRVRVNSILPGVVAWPDDTSAELRRAYEAKIPLARSGTPEDAARAIAWLALDATYVTGVELRVDGGRWLR